MRSPPAAEGLFAGLRTALGTGRREANLATLAGVDDWNAVARLTKRHRVAALVLRGLRRAGAACSEAEAALEPLRTASNAKGLAQLAGLRAALDCLDRRGIPSLALKGLPLSVRLFDTSLERECHDIDLLVPPSATAAATSALTQGGWQMREPSFDPTQLCPWPAAHGPNAKGARRSAYGTGRGEDVACKEPLDESMRCEPH